MTDGLSAFQVFTVLSIFIPILIVGLICDYRKEIKKKDAFIKESKDYQSELYTLVNRQRDIVDIFYKLIDTYSINKNALIGDFFKNNRTEIEESKILVAHMKEKVENQAYEEKFFGKRK